MRVCRCAGARVWEGARVREGRVLGCLSLVASHFAPTVRSARKGPFRSRARRSPIGRLASAASASRSGPPRWRHHLRSSLRRKLSACAYPAAAFRRLAARRRHLPCRPAAMRILCVIILHDWFLPLELALAAKDKISPRHGCTNALRLQLRGAVERPDGPCARTG